MSLGSHGYDREVNRAQHLFCHRADEQLAYLAPAPCTEQHAIHLKLADSGRNLLSWMPFARQRITAKAPLPGEIAPGPKHLLCDLKGSRGVVIRHARGVGGNGLRAGKHMEHDQSRTGLGRLFQCKRHQVIEIAQVSGNEDGGWMRPAVGTRFPHGKHLIPESLSPKTGTRCAEEHSGG